MRAVEGSWLLFIAIHCFLDATRAAESESVCYGELGCFSMKAPWKTLTRPFPAPYTPSQINTMIYYYSRTSPQRFNITLWPTISLNGADFDADRPATAFITHGFSSTGNASWLSDLKDNYLLRLDANVFLVDWGKGSKMANYLQVASNTRIVGAEIARFIDWLVKNQGLDVTTVHLMGHSLGAHICAYVGKRIPNIGRLTGFDPAQPGFEFAAKEVRLDKDDASFVEILHTNSLPFIPLLGFGLIRPRGDVDFYINGGGRQPGCKSAFSITKDFGKGLLHLSSIKDLLNHTVEEVAEWIGCSHGRSYMYYTTALANNCTMWGQHSNLARRLVDATTLGLLEPLFTSLENCTVDTCVPIGLETPLYPSRGPFAVYTTKEPPYCNNNITSSRAMKAVTNAILKTNNAMQSVKEKAKKLNTSIRNAIYGYFG